MPRLPKSLIKQLFSPEGYRDNPTLPPCLGGPCQIIITGNRSVYLDGCESLVDYADDHITFSLPRRTVTVYGKNLCITTFRCDEVAVCGQILGVIEGGYRREVICEDH